jgi:hypothetical protein
MTDIDLDAEFQASALRFRVDSRDKLSDRYGVPLKARFRVPGASLGIARIETSDSLYQPSEGGLGAIIIITGLIAGGGHEDLLAFCPAEPDKWYLRKGVARWLGEWELGRRLVTVPTHIEPPALASPCRSDDPLHIYSNPLEWLRNACDGAVPLIPKAYGDLTSAQSTLTFESPAHMAMAKKLMQRPVQLPEMALRTRADVAA